jgi:hypothetical protein
VSDWATIFLGVIAIATLATAIVQIAAFMAAGRVARRAERLMDLLETEVRPVLGHLNAIGHDASRAAALAAAQVERVDRALGMLVDRLEVTLDTIQRTVARPAREAAAVMAGVRTALSFLRDVRAGRARRRTEDHEDALFI